MICIFAQIAVDKVASAATSVFEDQVLVGVIICLFGLLVVGGWYGLRTHKEESVAVATTHDKRLESILTEHRGERDEFKKELVLRDNKNEQLLQEMIRHLKEK